MQSKANFEFIIQQRREFSYSKYRSHIENAYSPQNYQLIKVLSTMTLEGLEKAYLKKKENFAKLVRKTPQTKLPKMQSNRTQTPDYTNDSTDQEDFHSKFHIKKQEEVDSVLRLRPVTKSPQKIRFITEKEKNDRVRIHDHIRLYFEGKVPHHKESMAENQRSFFSSKNYYNIHYTNINKDIQMDPELKKKESQYFRKLQKMNVKN